jgi:hypothetical protein
MRRRGCMKKLDAILVVTALALALVGDSALAGGASKIGIKLGFGVAGYPSGKDLVTAPYKAPGDSPALFDSRTVMQYHFDQKFGKTGYGAVTYRIKPGVELEMGFGYTDLQMEITQHYKMEGWSRSADPPVYGSWGVWDYDTQRGAEFSYMTFRPGLNLLLSSKARLVPYLGVGFDIIRVKGKGNLGFLAPYVTQEGPNSYFNSTTERLDFEGSSVVFGFDLASGFELAITSGISANFGVSYLIEFNKAFKDFGAIVKENPAAPLITDVSYSADGITLANVGFTLGFILHL